ncbi:MAG: FHA domain-containing protein [Archangium sp.]
MRNVAWLERFDENVTTLLREPQMVLGRAVNSDIRLDNGRTSRRHMRFTRLDDGTWDVLDVASSGGTFVNHLKIRSSSDETTRGQRLVSGDHFNVQNMRFRSAFIPQVDHFALLDEQVEDEAAWGVWADSLLEKGHPLGGWLSAPPGDADSRQAFIGALAIETDPNVRVEWNRFGFAVALKLRDVALFQRPFFGDAARAPGLQYLTELELEPDERLFEVLRAIPLPKSLRRISGVRLPSEVLRDLRLRCPLLES